MKRRDADESREPHALANEHPGVLHEHRVGEGHRGKESEGPRNRKRHARRRPQTLLHFPVPASEQIHHPDRPREAAQPDVHDRPATKQQTREAQVATAVAPHRVDQRRQPAET